MAVGFALNLMWINPSSERANLQLPYHHSINCHR